ncbi:hypothetical protein [Oryza sativa Japonica Group]|uniref:Uncharacterized protein n=1 Tax=Oryza sativa subsp. japonica TaxID=39947 RepID=Q5QMA6_ORYSJ|nr:hypothetical protein [Oryza sativa Japonica Group]
MAAAAGRHGARDRIKRRQGSLHLSPSGIGAASFALFLSLRLQMDADHFRATLMRSVDFTGGQSKLRRSSRWRLCQLYGELEIMNIT